MVRAIRVTAATSVEPLLIGMLFTTPLVIIAEVNNKVVIGKGRRLDHS